MKNLSQVGTFIFILVFAVIAQAGRVPERLLIHGNPPVELTESARAFVEAELLHNPVVQGEVQAFHIEHLEIPLRAVSEDAGLGLDPEIRKSLVFEKNAVPYLRWVLNPEDTLYGEELKKYLAQEKIPFEVKSHFIGYLTSSRSCIVQDPQTGAIFSIKASTNQTAGTWKDKKETVRAAKVGRIVSDYIYQSFQNEQNATLRPVIEPLAFSLPGIDQAIIVRQYSHFKKDSNKILLPAFVALHKAQGVKMAGQESPVSYWQRNLVVPAVKASVELALNFGITYNSPHSQNLLIEMENGRPTGKIYIRDFGDSDLIRPIVEALGGSDLIEFYSGLRVNKIKDGNIEIKLGLNNAPVKPSDYNSWSVDLNTWEKIVTPFEWEQAIRETAVSTARELLMKTSYPLEKSENINYLKPPRRRPEPTGHYISAFLNLESFSLIEGWTNHLRKSSRLSCSQLF